MQELIYFMASVMPKDHAFFSIETHEKKMGSHLLFLYRFNEYLCLPFYLCFSK